MSLRAIGLGIDVTANDSPWSRSPTVACPVGAIDALGVYVSTDDASHPSSSITLCPSHPISNLKGPRSIVRVQEGLPPSGLGDSTARGSAAPSAQPLQYLQHDAMSPTGSVAARNISRTGRTRLYGAAAPQLQRQATIMSTGASPARKAAELKSLLGNANAKLKPGAAVLPLGKTPVARQKSGRWMRNKANSVTLERAKSRARVEVDFVLSSDTFVQGQSLSGHLTLRVRKCAKKESPVLLADAKVRVVGFECIPDEDARHVFYQHTRMLEEASYASEKIYGDGPDDTDSEGYRRGREGVHNLPFEMDLPVNPDGDNAKGDVELHGGAAVRYIVMISVKVKDADTSRRSLAHFYRSCSIWPQLRLQSILAPAPRALVSTAAKSLFLGGKNRCNKLKLTARLPRLSYFAGQRCYVHIRICNDTSRAVRGIAIALVRTVSVYRPRPTRGTEGETEKELESYETSSFVRDVAESQLELGERASKGHASAKGWWTGVEQNEETEFFHWILIPSDALSIARSRLLALDYTLRVTVTASSGAPGFTSDLSVVLPVRVVSMLSVDPPPSLSLPNEAVSINKYYKVIEAPQSVHRSQESDATSGTLPPYRTRPPSTHEASVSLEQPPYYRSHLPSTASRTGSSAGHDSKPKRRRSTKLVVANPSPSSTALSDALLQSTCCQPTPSTPDGHMGHQPAPRHDFETDEQTDHTLRLDQFTPGHQCQGPDEIERDEQIDENGDGDLGERDYSDYDGHRSPPTSLHCARSRARSHTVIRPSSVSAGIYGSPRGATKPPFRILAAGNASIAGSSYGRQAQISSQGRASAPKYQVDSQADGNDAGSGRKPEAGKGTEGSERAADARGNAAVRSSSGARSSFARRVRDKLARGQLANKHSGLPVVRPNDVDEPYSSPSQAAPLHNFKSQRPSHRAASRHCSAECAQYTFTLSDLQTQELSSSDLSGPIQAGGQSMPTGTSSSVASSVRYPDNTFCNPAEVAAPGASLSGPSGPTCAPSASSAAPDAGSPTSTMALLSATAPGPRAASSLVARPRPAASPRLQVQMPPRPRAARAPGSVMDRVMMLEQRVRAQEAEANSA